MNNIRRIAAIIALVTIVATGCQRASENTVPSSSLGAARLPAPFTGAAGVDTIVSGESRLFRREEDVTTLHPPVRIIRIYSYDAKGRTVAYKEGKDWTIHNGKIRRLPGSRIPDFGGYRYSTAIGCQNGVFTQPCARQIRCELGDDTCVDGGQNRFDFASEPRNPPITLQYNTYIDYVTALPPAMITAKLLGYERSRSVICLGDSITAGAHTPASVYQGSDSQSWCGLLRRQFPNLHFENRSIVDASLDGALQQVDQASRKADTAILAFGMNDHVDGSRDAASFRLRLEALVRQLERRNTRIILVGFFQQNELFGRERRADTLAFNRAISEVARRHRLPFVDVNAAFQTASIGYTPGIVFTADFMHHPNTYGQRIYYSLLAPYFIDRDTPARALPGYVIGLES